MSGEEKARAYASQADSDYWQGKPALMVEAIVAAYLAGHAEGVKDALRRVEELAIGLTRTYESLITNEQVEAVRLERLLQALREIGPLPKAP